MHNAKSILYSIESNLPFLRESHSLFIAKVFKYSFLTLAVPRAYVFICSTLESDTISHHSLLVEVEVLHDAVNSRRIFILHFLLCFDYLSHRT